MRRIPRGAAAVRVDHHGALLTFLRYAEPVTSVQITAGYLFVSLEEASLPALRAAIMDFGERHGMEGLVLIAAEGLNATVAGTPETIALWKQFVEEHVGNVAWKDSVAADVPFRRWSVKIKPEIVALKQEGIVPNGKHGHLPPEEWHAMLAEDDVVVLDTRNDYETAIGKFAGAIDPHIAAFHEFPAFVARADIPKNKKVLLYCTGGIRCEKALLEMERQGYEHVYQLDGGILAYLEQVPDGAFEGECFVFDHRVAVDQYLQPSSRYGLCPHCGHAGSESVRCRCGEEQKICPACMAQESRRTCSKRCANEDKKSRSPARVS